MTARTDRKLALIVGTLLAGFFTVCSAVQVATWTMGSVERTAHEVIPGPVGSLTLDVRSGNVTLVPSQNDSVIIDSSSSGTLKAPELEIRPEGARATINGGCPEITFGNCDADIVVQVPARTAIRVEAGSGDIMAEGLSGNLDLQSASGDVSGHDLSGFSVRLRSNSGDVDAGGVRAASVFARSGSGDVTVHMESVPETVEARSNSGDVVVLVPPGGEQYNIEADTNSGDVTKGIGDNDDAQRLLRTRSNSGHITIDYG